MSMFTQTLPNRGDIPFNTETAQSGSRNPLSADASGWSPRNPLNLILVGILAALIVALIALVAQELGAMPARRLNAATVAAGHYVTATTDQALYRLDVSGNFTHVGVLFGGVTAQVTGVSADGRWLRMSCGDGSGDACWAEAAQLNIR